MKLLDEPLRFGAQLVETEPQCGQMDSVAAHEWSVLSDNRVDGI